MGHLGILRPRSEEWRQLRQVYLTTALKASCGPIARLRWQRPLQDCTEGRGSIDRAVATLATLTTRPLHPPGTLPPDRSAFPDTADREASMTWTGHSMDNTALPCLLLPRNLTRERKQVCLWFWHAAALPLWPGAWQPCPVCQGGGIPRTPPPSQVLVPDRGGNGTRPVQLCGPCASSSVQPTAAQLPTLRPPASLVSHSLPSIAKKSGICQRGSD
jgi:hypothetical protein